MWCTDREKGAMCLYEVVRDVTDRWMDVDIDMVATATCLFEMALMTSTGRTNDE